MDRRALLLVALASLAPALAAAAAPEAEAQLSEARRLSREGQTKAAIAAAERAAALDPSSGDAWAELGGLRLAEPDLPGAIQAFERALTLEPHPVATRYNLALALRKAGRHAAAIVEYRRFLETSPDDTDALFGLAESLRADGQRLAAADAYERYATVETRPAQASWTAKARATAAELRAQAGAAVPQRVDSPAAPPKPTSAARAPRPAAQREAIALLEKRAWAEALPTLQAAVDAAPDDALLVAALAAAQLGQGLALEAQASYRRALERAPSAAAPALHLGLGEACRALGEVEQARQAFARGLELSTERDTVRALLEARLAALSDG
jgi:tetratricopeptide (TPR) repeat protein